MSWYYFFRETTAHSEKLTFGGYTVGSLIGTGH